MRSAGWRVAYRRVVCDTGPGEGVVVGLFGSMRG